MSIVVNSEPRIVSIKVTNSAITAALADGRTVSVPLAWSWRLAGQGVHWPDVDEDISAMGMLSGTPASRPRLSRTLTQEGT